jgi:hypothetical protein
MIDGFARNPSVSPGDELQLCVATDAPAFRVELYRWGAETACVDQTGWLDGRPAPHHLPFHDWACDNIGLRGEDLAAWPSYAIPIDADCEPGVHVAVLVESGNGPTPPDDQPAVPSLDARTGRALFVVRDAAPAAGTSILYKLPLLTWHAYNQVGARPYDPATGAGGWCLYTVPPPADVPVAVPPTVSVQRPGGGTGGAPFDTFNVDPLDPRTPRQTFIHWDARAVAWLERHGYRVDYCTDLDLSDSGGRDLLAGYRLLLSFGHDEYYSEPMRSAIERFVADGGNAAFFCGNTCWWQVTFDEPFAFQRLRHWWEEPFPGRPENALTGVSFRHGGERPAAAARTPPVGFAVQHADHWVYDGTGLGDGDRFGDAPDERLVGYECDGARFDRESLRRSGPVAPSGDDGTPEDFTILGVGDVGASGWGEGNRAATLGVHAPRGTVFTASTTDWPRLLAQGSPVVERMTHNVLERLGG